MTKEETLAYIKAYLGGDTAVGNIIPLRSVLESAIKYLSEPSLPSNLDEAAEESMPEEKGFLETDIYGGSEAVYSREQMLTMFKSGLERMAEQFQKIEGELVDWYSSPEGKNYCCGIKTTDSFEVPEGFYIKKRNI